MASKDSPFGFREAVESTRDVLHEYLPPVLLRGAEALRGKLVGVSEFAVQQGAAYLNNARAFYIYRALDTIEQCVVVMDRVYHTFDGSESPLPSGEPFRRIERNTLAALHTEIDAWLRKLRELLVEVLLFARTNGDADYLLYLKCQELRAYTDLSRDQHDFYACTCQNVQGTIKSLRLEITALERQVPKTRQWYRDPHDPKTATTGKPSGFRSRLKMAMTGATTGDLLLLGRSYESGYQGPSRSIHLDIGGPDYERSDSSATALGQGLGLIAARVLAICHDLVGVEKEGYVAHFQSWHAEGEALSEFARIEMDPVYDAGDFVLMHGIVARVLSVTKSEYGFASVTAKYLEAPPRPDEVEDSFPAHYVRPLLKAAGRRDQVRDELNLLGKNATDDEIEAALERAAVWFAKQLRRQTALRPVPRGTPSPPRAPARAIAPPLARPRRKVRTGLERVRSPIHLGCAPTLTRTLYRPSR